MLCCIWSNKCHAQLNSLLLLLPSQLDHWLLLAYTRYNVIPSWQDVYIMSIYQVCSPRAMGYALSWHGIRNLWHTKNDIGFHIYNYTQVSIAQVSVFLLLTKRMIQFYWIKVSFPYQERKKIRSHPAVNCPPLILFEALRYQLYKRILNKH